MKHNLEKLQIMPVAPIVIVGACDERVNFTTIGDICIAGIQPALITISCHINHYITKQIRGSKKFSVNIPSTNHMKEISYCSENSGHQVDKSLLLHYEIKDEVPFLSDFPDVMICELLQEMVYETRCVFLGKITHVYRKEVDYQPVLYTLDNQFHTIKPI